jgi:hypothetical protein
MLLRFLFATCVALSIFLLSGTGWCEPAPRGLRVSDDGRRLVTDKGAPFFYLADTAWELFHRLDRTEAIDYLDDRASKQFTVIQAVALAELDGLHTPNPYGHTPLIGDDPTKPDVKPGPRNDYWDHVDDVITLANERGLVVALLPSWGDKWNKKWGVGPEVFTPESAEAFGRWIGERYRDAAVIWVLGGDRPIENDTHRDVVERMAKGLRDGDRGAHLQTFHPVGGTGSAEHFHGSDWLDFNLRQNGHVLEYTGRYEQTRDDYARTPAKPVIDGEPAYEAHPIAFDAKQFGYTVAADVRRLAYWDLFGGACGHTYGHHSVWQMASADREPVNYPLMNWREALDAPGGGQMQHARALLESRPYEARVPDDTLVIPDPVATSVPGAGRARFAATRDAGGRWGMVYVPVGKPFRVRLDALRGERVRAWWFDPRTGESFDAGEHPMSTAASFTPPTAGELLDWVLVLDDVSQDYAVPGTGPSATP